MNQKLYTEMCSFLSGKELLLKEFQAFYEKNINSDRFIELFEDEYGAMYDAFKSYDKRSVTQEANSNKALGINEPVATAQEKTNGYSAEKTLIVIANIVLIVGIIGALIMAFTITYTTIEGKYSFQDKTVVNSMGIVLTIATLISSVAAWAFLRVISNISTSLKEINFKTK